MFLVYTSVQTTELIPSIVIVYALKKGNFPKIQQLKTLKKKTSNIFIDMWNPPPKLICIWQNVSPSSVRRSFFTFLSCLACCDRRCPWSPCWFSPETSASRCHERTQGAWCCPRRRHLPVGATAGGSKLQTPPLPLPSLWWNGGGAATQSQWLCQNRNLQQVPSQSQILQMNLTALILI